jgi:hypothetical protein
MHGDLSRLSKGDMMWVIRTLTQRDALLADN